MRWVLGSLILGCGAPPQQAAPPPHPIVATPAPPAPEPAPPAPPPPAPPPPTPPLAAAAQPVFAHVYRSRAEVPEPARTHVPPKLDFTKYVVAGPDGAIASSTEVLQPYETTLVADGTLRVTARPDRVEYQHTCPCGPTGRCPHDEMRVGEIGISPALAKTVFVVLDRKQALAAKHIAIDPGGRVDKEGMDPACYRP